MKRFLLCLTAILAMLALMTGCGGSVRIDGEENALKVYNYPSDNIIGLEKVAIFDDHVVAVFDAEKCDAGYGGLQYNKDNRFNRSYIHAADEPVYQPAKITLEAQRDKYILNFEYDYGDGLIQPPDHTLEIIGFVFDESEVNCADDSTKIECAVPGGDCTQFYYQTYDAKQGKWLKVEDELVVYSFGPEE